MIDYQMFCRIHHLHRTGGLNAAQIARATQLCPDTVSFWLKEESYRQRESVPRTSIVDPYRPEVVQLLEIHPYSARQIYQRLRDQGYPGSYNQIKRLVRRLRPRHEKAFLELTFAPGEAAQVDWTHCGFLRVGGAMRRLSCFVIVLCWSRYTYAEFTLRETMEHFLQCHRNGLEFFGRSPHDFIVDNCKTAILLHERHGHVDENPRYAEFVKYYARNIRACAVAKGNEKGRVESGCGYVKHNFLDGRPLSSLCALNAELRHWLDTVANVRIHAKTRRQPAAMFAEERAHLLALPAHGYDCCVTQNVRANALFRVNFDGNRYSVPAACASRPLVLHRYPDRLLFYREQQLVAEHVRCYDRGQSITNPEHEKPLLEQRQRARKQALQRDFLALAPAATTFYQGLNLRQVHPASHLRKIMALVQIHNRAAVAEALAEACELQAFHADYVAGLLEQRRRHPSQDGRITLSRNPELLDLRLTPPNLDVYRIDDDDSAAAPVIP